MPTASTTTTTTQYLQVPKTLYSRRARSKSRSRQNEQLPREAQIPPNSQVIVSPQKLSFRSRSPPPPPFRQESFRRASYGSQDATPTKAESMENTDDMPTSNYTTAPSLTSDLRINTLSQSTPRFKPSSYLPYRLPSPPPLSPPPTPPLPSAHLHPSRPSPSLRSRLIGAWTLESYIAYPTPTSTIQRPTFPMTKNVTGFILYTPDGYMSAQMLIPGQRPFARGAKAGEDEAQWAEAGKRCFAYCGPYYISSSSDGEEEVLRHTFQCCSLPGWVGDVQVRTHRFEEDGRVLILGSEGPTEIKGDKRIPVLKWRRARDISHSDPPAPTPQIRISGPGEP